MFDKEKLKQAMDDHGDTNKALAVFLGMTASNFSTIWNGRQPVQRKHIVRIAVRYQRSPQDVWDIFFLADAEAIKKEAKQRLGIDVADKESDCIDVPAVQEALAHLRKERPVAPVMKPLK